MIPQEFHDWRLANFFDAELIRDPKYIKFAHGIQKKVNTITCNPILFCVTDPERIIKRLEDNLQDINRVFKHFKAKTD